MFFNHTALYSSVFDVVVPYQNFLYYFAVFLIISLVATCICTCFWTYFCSTRINTYGSCFIGYEHNLWIRHSIDPSPEIEEDRRISKEMTEEEIDELMDVSIHTHPQYLQEEYDAIIIGSGLAGLSVGGFLSRAGKKCLILEAHDRFGGCCHTYEEKGYEFCSGIHFINNADHPMIRFAVDVISDGQINLESIEEEERDLFDFGEKVVELKGHQSLERLERDLPKQFPHEKEGITRFFFYAKQVRGAFEDFAACRHLPSFIQYFCRAILGWEDKFHRFGMYSASEVLDFCEIEDVILRSILTANQALISSHPVDEYIFPMCVLMLEIGWQKSKIVGGGVQFPRKIISTLKSDSKAIHHTQVKRILCNNGKAIGIELESGECIHAENIISTAGIERTYRFLPKNIRRKTCLKDVFKEFDYTGFCFLVHIGLRASPEELGIGHIFSVHYGIPDGCKARSEMKKLRPPKFDGYEKCFVLAVGYDYNEEEPNRTKLTLGTYCFPEWFSSFTNTESGKRGNEYEEWKGNLTKKVLDVFFKKYPNLEEHLDFFDSATNLTMRDYVLSPNGSSYGFNQSYEKLDYVTGNLGVLNPIPNLHLAGQDITMDGVLSVIMSSLPSVGSIIGRNMFMDFSKAEKKHEKILKDCLSKKKKEKKEKKEKKL